MPLVQNGSINLSAQIVPDAFVVIVPPSVTQLNGIPTNVGLIVGSAAWGPVNSPRPFSDLNAGSRTFGPMKARKYDLLTAAACAVLQGGNNFLGIRVTDGTEAAAQALVMVAAAGAVQAGGAGYVVGERVTLANGAVVQVSGVNAGAVTAFTKVSEPTTATAGILAQVATSGAGAGFTTAAWTYTTGVTLTSKYTGSGANADSLTIAAGGQANSYRVTIGRPGQNPEVYENISGAANAFWVALANAINNGVSGLRGPSQFMVAAAGASVGAPTLGTYTLAGGADGATNITPAILLGADGTTRTGLYAGRNTLASLGMLADADDTTTWAAQVAFGLSEGIYMIGVGPAGQTPTQAATAKSNAGIDSYAFKALLGDWVYINDTVNGQVSRLVSPQGIAMGRLQNLGAQHSGLNKQVFGIIGTQSSVAGQVYSTADLQILGNAGIDVIAKPAPGGDYFALRFGRNTSSDPNVRGDNYTRLTNYIAKTLVTGVGRFVGQLQSKPQRESAEASVSAMFEVMAVGPDPMIGNAQGTQPYQVQINDNNNPPNAVAQGIERCDARVQFLSVVETFVVSVEGGQSVVINRNTEPLGVAA